MAVALKRLFQGTPTGLVTPVMTEVTVSSDTGTLTLLGTYGYKVTAKNATGESPASAEMQGTLVGGNQTLIPTWLAVPGATSYGVYGRTAGGPWGLLASPAILFYKDTGSASPGAAPPSVNTSGPTANYSATTKTIVKQAVFANPTSVAALCYLALVPSGASIDGTHYLVPGFQVNPGDSLVFDCLQVLAVGDFLSAWSSVAGVIATLSGVEDVP